MAFSFLAYLFSFWRYLRFCIISDDVIGGSTKAAQHSIEKNSRNIKAVFFKLGTSSVHRKRDRVIPTMLLPWQHSWLQSPSVKNQISPFATF